MVLLVVGTRDWQDQGNATGLMVFRFQGGEAAACGVLPTGANPAWFDFTADKRQLYVSCEEDTGSVELYDLRTGGGGNASGCPVALAKIGAWVTDAGSCHVAALPSGAAVSNYVGGSVSFLRSGAPAAVATHPLSGAVPKTPGFEDRQEAPHAHHALPVGWDEAAKRWVVAVSDLGTDSIEFYSVAEDGGSAPMGRALKCAEGAGPRRVVSAGGGHLYCMNELNGSVTAYAVDLGGDLTAWEELQTVSLGKIDRSHHRGGAEVAVSPCGGYLVAGIRSTDELVVFRRDRAAGTLAIASRCPAAGTTPRHHAFWHDAAAGATWLFATCHVLPPHLHGAQQPDQVAVFAFDEAQGVLTHHVSIPCSMPPACIGFLDE